MFASWNLSRRRISIFASGDILANGKPLRFYHFTKLGSIGDTMTRRYAGDNIEVYEIWSWYRRKIDKFIEDNIPNDYWHYGQFSNQRPIPKQARVLYRTRADLQIAFTNPFEVTGDSFYDWLRKNGKSIAAQGLNHKLPGEALSNSLVRANVDTPVRHRGGASGTSIWK